MCDWRKSHLKTLLRLMCFLLSVMGVVVCLSVVYQLMKYKESRLFFSDPYITLPAIITFVSAVCLVVSGWLGFLVSFRESKCLQGLFVYLLVVVICVESTASVLAFYHSMKLDSEVGPLTGVFQSYTGNSQDPKARAVDATQEELQCCGVHDYKDWLETSWFVRTGGLSVPNSCCNSTFPSCNGTVNQPWQLYRQGCQVKLEMTLHFVLRLIMWGYPLVLLVEVVLLLTVIQLMREEPFTNYHLVDPK